MLLLKNKNKWQYLFTKTAEKVQSSNFAVEAEVLQRWTYWWKFSGGGKKHLGHRR